MQISRVYVNTISWTLPVLLSACSLLPALNEKKATPAVTSETEEVYLTSTPSQGSIDSFRDFLQETMALSLSDRQEAVNLYTAQIDGFPLEQEDLALFVWRGEGLTVKLIGDMNNWDWNTAPQLNRLEGTDFWFLELQFERDSRLDYQYLIDDRELRLDPLNPETQMSGNGPNSVLKMPDYQPAVNSLLGIDVVPEGDLSTHTFESVSLNEIRTFIIYRPPGQLIGEKLPSVYINDGSDYINLIDAPRLLNALIGQRLIPPLLVIFVPPINRLQEYDLNKSYTNFLADELVPFVQENFGADSSPDRTAIMGASMGGRAAIYTAMERPDVFGLVASQSGAFAGEADPLLDAFEKANQTLAIEGEVETAFKPYLVVGAYETNIPVKANERENFLAGNRRLAELLRIAGYDLIYEEEPQGHSWGLWKDTLGRALGVLFNQ